MKFSKCATCGDHFKASTSTEIKRLESEHVGETGHRSYIGILGWSSHTFPPGDYSSFRPAAPSKPDRVRDHIPVHHGRTGLAAEIDAHSSRLNGHYDKIWDLQEENKKLRADLTELELKVEKFAILDTLLVLAKQLLAPPVEVVVPPVVEPTQEAQPTPAPAVPEPAPVRDLKPRQKRSTVGLFGSSVVAAFPKRDLTPEERATVLEALKAGFWLSEASSNVWPKSSLRDLGLTQTVLAKTLNELYENGHVLVEKRARKGNRPATWVSAKPQA